jgi:hypothetical protein
MPDAGTMPSPDINSLPVQIALAAIGIGLVAWLLPRQLRITRQYGGRPTAIGVVAAGVIVLGVSLQPEIVSPQDGLALTLIGVVIALRPEAVVRLTGGPRPEWQALAEGTALQRAVAKHHDRRAAQRSEAVREGLVRLAAAETPATSRYIELLRATLFADSEGPGMADRLAALAVEEAALRKVIGPRPAFEGGLVTVDEAPAPVAARDDDPGEAGDPGEAEAEADEAE